MDTKDKKVQEISLENMDIVTEVKEVAGHGNDDPNESFEFWNVSDAIIN